mmetsp:Transcript_9473/g.17257  ORF Transcript_9473/g.17257 Transcript_9473/m.17257 type:complete len:108 (+) Transcript_9473:728-1051(+)
MMRRSGRIQHFFAMHARARRAANIFFVVPGTKVHTTLTTHTTHHNNIKCAFEVLYSTRYIIIKVRSAQATLYSSTPSSSRVDSGPVSRQRDPTNQLLFHSCTSCRMS